ncbi:MAG TPA: hypothetical protein VF872_05095 [Gaiellaceae bacterium]
MLNGEGNQIRPAETVQTTGRRRLTLNQNQAVVSLTSYGVSLVAVTALLPILVRVLGAKQYGAWVLTGGLVNYVTLVDFGMSLTISRFVALAHGKRLRDAEEAIGVALTVVGAVGATIAIAIIPLAGRWEKYLGVDGSAFALRAAACALVALLLSKVFQSALEGAGKVALSRVVQTIGTVSFAAAAAAVVLVSAGKLEALSIVLLANTFGLLITYALLLAREWRWTIPVSRPGKSAWRNVVAYALTTQTGSIVALSVDPISRLLLAAVAGPAAVAPLDIALRTSAQWFGAGLAFTRPILPSLGHLSHDEELAARRADDLWRRFLGVGIATGIYAAIVVYFVFPTLFGDVGQRAGTLAATSILLVTTSVVATVPYVYVILYGRARNLLSIQVLTSAVGIGLMLTMIWWIDEWAPVLGLGFGSLFGALLTVRIARKRAGMPGLFGVTSLSPQALATTLAASVAVVVGFLAPGPLVARGLFASAVWLAFTFPEIRGLLRSL